MVEQRRQARRGYNRRYYQANRERLLARSNAYAAAHSRQPVARLLLPGGVPSRVKPFAAWGRRRAARVLHVPRSRAKPLFANYPWFWQSQLASRVGLSFGALCVECEEPLEEFHVRQIVCPPVRVEYGTIKPFVSHVQPRGSSVVEA